ncbi:MAG: ribonuclease R [Candidatus Yonathbacteria bacterium RIFOXYC1_FULL_52_10]|uniref:Ribonuclease R n=1 Tax=Candidatus Yonathbacteria bacterium RIFOXYD1_FULL_52_36 TaxID=1802730 RepID=A0A1G2SIX3_9BACT|nr:MAG: ribonuclease R [Candidatus Yonathbacteria bacterium RIFOXYC1_FULL_52_10]OHA84970.1 MAG: ribonuclease R [Candidatus Yonathbacteria bacterium RIFOXYD1_FULL_52_36]
MEGTISLTTKAVGYVTAEGFDEDIEIPPQFIHTALHRDIVRVVLHPRVEGERQRGEVAEIVKRNKTEFVGTLEQSNGSLYLIPQDQKVYVDILITKGAPENKAGYKALVRITHWPDAKHSPEGELLKILGRAGEHNTEIEAIVLDKGLDPHFPEHAEDAARVIKAGAKADEAAEIARRRDMREVLTFTIDPDDAKDFDDALSFQTLPNGDVEIGVHIADVTHFVKKDSPLDQESSQRATSIYLVDRVIPMLPETLSNDLCSLNAHEVKLTFSAVFTFTPDSFEAGKPITIKDTWIGETVIYSDKRFTYEEAQKILDDKAGLHFDELYALDKLAKKLRAQRIDEGALLFDHDEIKFILDENNIPIGVKRKKIQDTNHLIEEFMLLANRRVAEYVGKKGHKENVAPHERPFVYRIHDAPNPEKMVELVDFVRRLGYKVKLKDGTIDSRSINALLKEVEGKPEENMIQTAAVRSMAKAIYSTKNIGHYGLAFEHYTHFTSPIRRYPDMMVHRLTKEYLAGRQVPAAALSEYQSMAEYASDMERRASEAERASIKYKQVEYMGARTGQIFNGTISGVAEWGVYVEEEETRCEGLVKIGNLGNDYYTLDKANYAITGSRTNKRYRLGDRIKVKVLRVDPVSRQIDYGIVE